MATAPGQGSPGEGLAGDLADVGKVLDALTDVVAHARSMPMSASCVVNRAEVLGLVEQLRRRLPEALGKAQDVLGDREGVVDDGRREAERVLQEAHERAEAVRAEVEDYVDAKLANFEIVLTKTLQAVERGRQKLSGAHELDALREDDDDLPPLPS